MPSQIEIFLEQMHELLEAPVLRGALEKLLGDSLATYQLPDGTLTPAIWVGEFPVGSIPSAQGVICVIEGLPDIRQTGYYTEIRQDKLWTIVLDLLPPAALDPTTDELPKLYSLEQPVSDILIRFDPFAQMVGKRQATSEYLERAVMRINNPRFVVEG